MDLRQNVEGENVIIVEDILDTGRTLHYLVELLKVHLVLIDALARSCADRWRVGRAVGLVPWSVACWCASPP